jgi:hypothetical protein
VQKLAKISKMAKKKKSGVDECIPVEKTARIE